MTDLDELERLLREATRGPWSSTPSIPEQGYECFWITACPEINQEREVATVCGPQTERNTANAALIAALRNSAEELIRDARRWRDLDLSGVVHDAVLRALDEAGVRNEVLRGMCLEVAIEKAQDAIAQEGKE